MFKKQEEKVALSKMTPRERAKARVSAFTKRMRYQGYLRSGMPVEQAARMVGIKIPYGQRAKPEDIQKILEPEKNF